MTKQSMSFIMLHAALFGATMMMTTKSQSIPDTPDTLCVYGDATWDYDYNNYYWVCDRTSCEGELLAFSDSIDAWTIYNQEDGINDEIMYCSEMPSDYTPTTTNPGDPSDCQEWTKSNGDTLSSDEVAPESDCFNIDLELNFVDWLFVIYAIIVVIIISILCINGGCDPALYDATDISTYEAILEQHGFNKNRTVSGGEFNYTPKNGNNSNNRYAEPKKIEDRRLASQLLKHDLQSDKLVWTNNYWIDFFIYLRTEHPVFSPIFGHPLHTYSIKERRWTFIGVQFLSIAFSAWVTLIFLFAVGLPESVIFILSFQLDSLLGLLVSISGWMIAQFAICSCADKGCCRSCLKACGSCGLGCIIFIATLFGIGSFMFIFGGLELIYPEIEIMQVVSIWSVNFITGLVFGWFLIDFISDYVYFTNEWFRQGGIAYHKEKQGVYRMTPCNKLKIYNITFKQNEDYTIDNYQLCDKSESFCKYCKITKNEFLFCERYCGSKCCLAWVCCLGCCHFCCKEKCCNQSERKLKAQLENENKYPKETLGGIDIIVGNSKNKTFAVTWQDYQRYKIGFDKTNGVELRQDLISNIIKQDIPQTPKSPARRAAPDILADTILHSRTMTGTSTPAPAPDAQVEVEVVTEAGDSTNNGYTSTMDVQVTLPPSAVPDGNTKVQQTHVSDVAGVADSKKDDSSFINAPLPPGWERSKTDDGKVFYINHNTKQTQWFHPNNPNSEQATQPQQQ